MASGHLVCSYLVDDVPKGEVGHRHPCVAAQRHIDGVVLHAVHLLVQLDQICYYLQATWKETGVCEEENCRSESCEHVYCFDCAATCLL